MLVSTRRSFSSGALIALLLTGALLGGPTGAASAQSAPSQGGDDGLKETTVRRDGRAVRTVVPQQVAAPDGRPMRNGSIVVRFRSGTRDDDKDDVHKDAAIGEDDVEPTRERDTVRVKVDQAKLAGALAAYRGRGNVVAAADPDYIVKRADTPNDPRLADQWALAKVNASAAWTTTHGSSSIKIAVLDCGVYSSSSSYDGPNGLGHVDVRAKVGLERDFTGSPTGADDLCNHGTHVAGIAAASTNNDVGVAGLGFNATILNGKVLADDGVGTLAWIISGINWATANGAKVVNMSLSGGGSCPATLQTAVNAAWSAGVVIVAAAGNDGANGAGWPGNCANVVAVAATDSADKLADISNYGSNVDVAAPGTSILSTINDGTYGSFSGTSMAAPHVAGLAALVWATDYGTSQQAVVNRIVSSGKQLSDRGWTFRRIDAAAAVGGTTAPPTTRTLTVRKSGTGSGTVSGSGLSCTTSCSSKASTYADGAKVTLTATAASGSSFGGWSGCDSTSGSSCTVTMNGNRTVTATFTASTACAAPKPTIANPTRTAALTYRFTATPKVDPKCTVASVEWKTSNGQTASGSSATIKFPKKGTYTITVTVTDSSGKTGRASRTLSVK